MYSNTSQIHGWKESYTFDVSIHRIDTYTIQSTVDQWHFFLLCYSFEVWFSISSNEAPECNQYAPEAKGQNKKEAGKYRSHLGNYCNWRKYFFGSLQGHAYGGKAFSFILGLDDERNHTLILIHFIHREQHGVFSSDNVIYKLFYLTLYFSWFFLNINNISFSSKKRPTRKLNQTLCSRALKHSPTFCEKKILDHRWSAGALSQDLESHIFFVFL